MIHECSACNVPYIEPTTGEEHDIIRCSDYSEQCPCKECHDAEHKCEFIRVGTGIPFVWDEILKMEKITGKRTLEFVRNSILRECLAPCEDAPDAEHILFCPGCKGVKKLE